MELRCVSIEIVMSAVLYVNGTGIRYHHSPDKALGTQQDLHLLCDMLSDIVETNGIFFLPSLICVENAP